ncbi:MAG: Trp biosynthesis-associated membrane protein [Nocardioidaceae bacterium]
MPDSPWLRRRGYAVTLLVGVAGAAAVAVGVSRPWVTATATAPGLPSIHASASGADVAPLAGALGFVLLAAFGAVIATKGWVRRGLGALIVVVGVVVLVSALNPGGAGDVLADGLSAKGWTGGDQTTDGSWWRWLVVVGACVCALGGAVVARYGAQWAVMGSKYDAPSSPHEGSHAPAADLSEGDVWRAIDRGHDPTADT